MVNLRRRAKLRVDQSNRCGDLAIFSILKMAAATVWDFQKFGNFSGRNGQQSETVSLCQISLRLVKLLPKYGAFSIFLRWRRPPS